MTRRRIIFRTGGGIGFWITPEINGDSDELKRIGAADTCDLTWLEIKNLFRGVQSWRDFQEASDAAQRSFHSSIAAVPPEPPRHMLSLDGICCDELYEACHGEVRRVYGSNPIHVQIHYREQESPIVDTAQFDCPPGVTQEEVLRAVRDAQREMPIGDDEDRVSWMDDVLTRASLALSATWEYVTIAGSIEVD